MESEEVWRNMPGLEDSYMISSKGNVWRKWRPKRSDHHSGARRPGVPKLSTRKGHGHKYLRAEFPDGKCRNVYIHRMVALAFIPKTNGNNEVCHKNDIPDDNRVENLYWGNKRTNQADLIKNKGHHFGSRDACSNGHEYTEENTRYYYRKDRGTGPERICRTCEKLAYYKSSRHQATLQGKRKANDK